MEVEPAGWQLAAPEAAPGLGKRKDGARDGAGAGKRRKHFGAEQTQTVPDCLLVLCEWRLPAVSQAHALQWYHLRIGVLAAWDVASNFAFLSGLHSLHIKNPFEKLLQCIDATLLRDRVDALAASTAVSAAVDLDYHVIPRAGVDVVLGHFLRMYGEGVVARLVTFFGRSAFPAASELAITRLSGSPVRSLVLNHDWDALHPGSLASTTIFLVQAWPCGAAVLVPETISDDIIEERRRAGFGANVVR